MTQLLPGSRSLHLIDIAVAVWVAGWIGLGVAIGVNVRHLTVISHTVQSDGHAVQSIGASLHALGKLPFIGGQIGHDAAQVQRAGAGAVSSGASSASSIHALSVLLAIAVALLPSVPVFAFYLPLRLERRREAGALKRSLRIHGGDPAFQEFLARRAVEALAYHRLEKVSHAPWLDAAEGDTAALAAAELRRLGLSPRLLDPARRSRR